jgi:hypothetical protein
MSSKPTIDEIRARLANHTQVLAHRHYAQDVGVLLEMLDEAHEALRELACYVAAGGYNAPDPISVPEFVAKIRWGIDHDDDVKFQRLSALEALINNPQTESFLDAVRVEAAHQQERWGVDHDAGKADADWFWLIGYLAGKALRPENTLNKKLHHIITTAAVCLNWHGHATGMRTRMRPGIEPPTDLAGEEAAEDGLAK